MKGVQDLPRDVLAHHVLPDMLCVIAGERDAAIKERDTALAQVQFLKERLEESGKVVYELSTEDSGTFFCGSVACMGIVETHDNLCTLCKCYYCYACLDEASVCLDCKTLFRIGS